MLDPLLPADAPALDPSQAQERVVDFLRALDGGGVVALSGGADSALVLSLAAEAWGPDRCVAVSNRSESLPARELAAAREQAQAVGVEHVALRGSELDIEAFRKNAPDRCFHCKDHLYGALQKVAQERGLAHVLDGTNADDRGDHRPGMAAARNHGVISPLLETGIGKVVVRSLSKARGLATWDKPAEACLSSRFPYGTTVTRSGLARVEQAELVLKDLGFRNVRVRVHDPVARIEVPLEELDALLQPGTRERVVAGVKAAGFAYVALDLEGFRSGSLNEMLRTPTNGDGS